MQTIEEILIFCVLSGLVLVPALFVVRILGAIAFPTLREAIRGKKVLYSVWFVVSALFVFGLFCPGSGHGLRAGKRARNAALMNQIRTAILAYQTEYETLPPGKDNASLIGELEGDNPRHIPFLNLKPTDKNVKGEVLDPWGTPLSITVADRQHPLIQSAGPDKEWGTLDDFDNAKSQP